MGGNVWFVDSVGMNGLWLKEKLRARSVSVVALVVDEVCCGSLCSVCLEVRILSACLINH